MLSHTDTHTYTHMHKPACYLYREYCRHVLALHRHISSRVNTHMWIQRNRLTNITAGMVSLKIKAQGWRAGMGKPFSYRRTS